MIRNLFLSIALSFGVFSTISTATAAERETPPEESVQKKSPEKEELMPNFLGADFEKEQGEKFDIKPQFEGRDLIAFKCWVLQNLRFSGEGLAAGQGGNVVVSFTITEEGTLSDVVCIPGSDELLVPAVVNLLAQSPTWTPAMRDGEPVASKHLVGFDIQLCTVDGVDGLCSEDHTLYNVVDTMPAFGNDDAGTFGGWVKERLEKQFGGDTAILKGAISLEFVVEKDGSMSELKIANAMNAKLARAVGEIMMATPAWNPGILFGQKVRVGMVVPVCFSELPDSVYTQARLMAEVMPQFYGGGLDRFRNWVAHKIVYPQKALANNIQGRVLLEFVVEKDGSLSNIVVLNSPDEELSNEVLRIIRSAPRWVPGVQDGKVVRVKYTIPIDFRM